MLPYLQNFWKGPVVKAKESCLRVHVFDPPAKHHFKRNKLKETAFDGTYEKNINETDYNKYVDIILMHDTIN
jgi:hypothetical protein